MKIEDRKRRGKLERNYELNIVFFFFQAEDGIRDHCVTGVQTYALLRDKDNI